ncbi:RNA-binding protein [Salinarimonas soli]|uniref:RNA-binding protein n=1 Tax=Salinarimonas soli TaxID=1638099 RepID=A0A5B2V9P9_9HYPH|nr:RNA-binding protein [Salinarimonas soli]
MSETHKPRHSADVAGNANRGALSDTGAAQEEHVAEPMKPAKDPAAVSLGRKGGVARAATMTPERRAEIARKAAAKRWGK